MDAKLRSSLPASMCGKRFHPGALSIIRETIAEYEPAYEPQRDHPRGLRAAGLDGSCGRREEVEAAAALLRFHHFVVKTVTAFTKWKIGACAPVERPMKLD